MKDGPLRMTLDNEATCGVVEFMADLREDDLKRILWELGEIPGASRASKAVFEARSAGALRTTFDLACALRRGGIGSPRRLSQAFQAFRMAVNDELPSLRRGLIAAERVLSGGGTLTVISFESLMDRIVKQTFRPIRPFRPHPGEPDPIPIWEPIHRKVVRPDSDEVARNPRARSARLRAARRIAHG
jgi:16S rRNA (cytosine1402-N4)-methyltransferase